MEVLKKPFSKETGVIHAVSPESNTSWARTIPGISAVNSVELPAQINFNNFFFITNVSLGARAPDHQSHRYGFGLPAADLPRIPCHHR